MTYGIQINGSDTGGTYTVADTSGNNINLVVRQSGNSTGSVSGISSSAGITDRPFFMFRPSSNHNDAYIYTRYANVVSSNMRFGRAIVTESSGQGVTNYSVQDRNFDWMDVVDSEYQTPSGNVYGVQVKDSAGRIAFDTRNLPTDNSFNLTHYVESNSVGGYYGSIYSGTDYLSKYVDTREMYSFWTTVGRSSADSLFVLSGFRWSGNGIQHYKRISLYSQEAGGNASTNYFNNNGAIWIGEKR